MSFSNAITDTVAIGDKRLAWGSFTSGSTTGGTVTTGLASVESFVLCPNKATTAPTGIMTIDSASTTLPQGKDGVVIKTDSGISGYWQAIGS